MAIKERNLVSCIVFTIITCGIYMIYWCIMVARESVSVKDPSDSGLV